MATLTNEEITKIRNVRIHKILSLDDKYRRISIRCPIHQERSPSFVLYPDNSFYCFGCGVSGGGAIDFCIALGYDFVQACEELLKYV